MIFLWTIFIISCWDRWKNVPSNTALYITIASFHG